MVLELLAPPRRIGPLGLQFFLSRDMYRRGGAALGGSRRSSGTPPTQLHTSLMNPNVGEECWYVNL